MMQKSIQTWTWIAGGLFLSGCGTTLCLDRLQTLEAKQEYAEIAAKSVPSDCRALPFKSDACPKIHAIRGEACLALLRRETAANAACPQLHNESSRRAMDCALESYSLLDPLPGDGAARENVAENRARVMYCAAHTRPATEATVLIGRARNDLSRLPGNARRDLLAASSALFIAQQAAIPARERCTAAHDAMALATRGLSGVQADELLLANGLRGTRAAAMQEIASISQCGGA